MEFHQVETEAEALLIKSAWIPLATSAGTLWLDPREGGWRSTLVAAKLQQERDAGQAAGEAMHAANIAAAGG